MGKNKYVTDVKMTEQEAESLFPIDFTKWIKKYRKDL